MSVNSNNTPGPEVIYLDEEDWKAGSRHKNRSYARDKKAHKKDPHS